MSSAAGCGDNKVNLGLSRWILLSAIFASAPGGGHNKAMSKAEDTAVDSNCICCWLQ